MRGAYLVGLGKVELQALEKSDGAEVLLDIQACGICHSDRKAYGKLPAGMQLPRILGHEVVGKLLVDLPHYDLHLGDRVVAWPALVCGECEFCLTDRENLCPDICLFGYHLDGGFAEKFCLPSEDLLKLKLLKLPDHVSNEAATFLEPLACIVNGLDKYRVYPERLLIVGAGIMGRLAARVFRKIARCEVFFHDQEAERLEQAMADGSEYDGKYCDGVLIAASGKGAVLFGLEHLAPGGTMLLFSGQSPKLIEVDHNQIHQREQTLTGVYGCRFVDMKIALSLLAGGQVGVKDLVSRRVTIEQIPDELGKTMNHDDYKIVMVN